MSNKKYLVSVGDGFGFGEDMNLVVSKSRLSKIIGRAIVQGIIASAEIEGEGVDSTSSTELLLEATFPEKLLAIKD